MAVSLQPNSDDRAIAQGERAVELLRRVNKPEAEPYARHLAEYRSRLPAPAPAGAAVLADGSIATTAVLAGPATQVVGDTPAAGPGVLRMALSAAKSAAKFAGSGFKTVDPAVYRVRLAVCSTCDQHTGLRCRVCGCITAAKARLGHEDCPVGKWPR